MSQVMATRHDGAHPTDPPSLQWKMSCEVEVRATVTQYFLGDLESSAPQKVSAPRQPL